MVRDIADLMRERAEAKGLDVDAGAWPRSSRASFGPTKPSSARCSSTCVGNAVKFTPQGGVTLRLGDPARGRPASRDAGHRGRGHRRRHRRGGPGSASSSRSSSSAHQSDQKGTGLGLTITRQFVELMGGAIRVESAPGQGIDVPRRGAGGAGRRRPTVARGQTVRDAVVARLAPGQPEYRVLIVEDQAENWQLLRQLLERAGFQVRVAENGAEGVEAFQSWRPHFIWMDWRMPVMDGLEATRRIRALDGGREVKIVALSASVFKEEREQVLAAGVDDFVPKPIQFERDLRLHGAASRRAVRL